MSTLYNSALSHIFSQLIALLQEELDKDLQGILVTGSRIHGTPGPTSDIDVHVVIASPRRRRKNIVLDDIEIEMFFNPAFQIRRYFHDVRGIDQHMFTFGHAIYDPSGIIAELQHEARTLWEAGPPELSQGEYWQRRYNTADLLRDIEDVANGAEQDEATIRLLTAIQVERLIETHYRLQKRWLQKPQRLLADLERWDRQAAGLAREALEGRSQPARINALQEMAGYVLHPIGGVMPLEWSIEWEELQSGFEMT